MRDDAGMVPARGEVVPRRGESLPVPVEAVPTGHEARPMGFANIRLRDACWQALDERVRARLEENAGGIVEWWACDPREGDGRPAAVVFGPRELCEATPSHDGERPVYVISGRLLDPNSARSRTFEHRPAPDARPEPQAAALPAHTRAVDIGLPDEVRGVLGNLPPQVQTFLQAPFTGGRRVETWNWHYEGTDRRLDVFVLYLAGEQNVTLATGTKVVPDGHTDATAHWRLTCHQARVVGLRGL